MGIQPPFDIRVQCLHSAREINISSVTLHSLVTFRNTSRLFFVFLFVAKFEKVESSKVMSFSLLISGIECTL
jgi:hypothetical protein